MSWAGGGSKPGSTLPIVVSNDTTREKRHIGVFLSIGEAILRCVPPVPLSHREQVSSWPFVAPTAEEQGRGWSHRGRRHSTCSYVSSRAGGTHLSMPNPQG
jgi:hypothetical protein